ncbi:MAG: Ig-like domain-containing protein [Planctomycetales bacterium]|nr:Ig-like domain-containing protein [Planctomycetales bacterium]
MALRKSSRQRKIESLEDRRLLAIDFPVPMYQVGPGAYLSTVESFVSRFSPNQDARISLQGQQTATVTLTPTDELFVGDVEIFSPTGESIPFVPVTVGHTMYASAIDIDSPGEYSVRVAARDGAYGNFSLSLYTNVVHEDTLTMVQANQLPSSAVLLEPEFEVIPGTQALTVFGSRPNDEFESVVGFEFDDEILPVEWTTFSSSESGRIRITDEFTAPGNFALWMDQAPDLAAEPDVMPSDVDTSVIYDVETGRVSIQSVFPLFQLQLYSSSGLFTDIASMNLDGPLDVFRPERISHSDLRGFQTVDFGIILPAGLSDAFLRQDLSFRGDLVSRGQARVALGNDQLRLPVSNEVTMQFNIADIDSPVLEYDALGTQPVGPLIPNSFQGHVQGNGVSVSVDGEHWYSVHNYEKSFGLIDLALIEQGAQVEFGDVLFVRFQHYNNGSLPDEGNGYDNIRISAPINLADWYKFTLDDGQLASIMWRTSQSGQPIVIYNSMLEPVFTLPAFKDRDFRDTTTNGIPDEYYLEVPRVGFTYELELIKNGSFAENPAYLADQTPILFSNRFHVVLPDHGPFAVETIRLAGGELNAVDDPVLQVSTSLREWFSQDNSGEGLNERLELPAASSTAYTFDSRSTYGRTGLVFQGLSTLAFAPQYTKPVDHAAFNYSINSVEIRWDGAYRLDTLQPDRFLLNGVPAEIWIDNSGVFFLSAADGLQEGEHHVQILPAAIQRLTGQYNEAIDIRFRIDVTPPTIVSSTIAPGSIIPTGWQHHQIQFSEPVQSDVLLEIVSAEGVRSFIDLDVDQNMATFDLDLPEGDYTLILKDEFVTDLAGNQLDGEASQFPTGNGFSGGSYEVAFQVDRSNQVIDLADNLSPYPFGRLSQAQYGELSAQDDTDSFLLANVQAGTTFSVRLASGDLAKLTLRLLDSQGALISENNANHQGVPLALNHTASQSGDYQIEISAANGSPGQYEVEVVQQGIFEPDEALAPNNDSLDTATSLDVVMTSLSNSETNPSFAIAFGDFNAAQGVPVYVERFDAPLSDAWVLAGATNIEIIASDESYSPDQPNALSFRGNGEAILTVPMAQAADRILVSFAMMEKSETAEPLPERFEGSTLGDGMAVSVDGTHWIRMISFPNQGYLEWQTYVLDVTEILQHHNVQIGDTLYVKVQNSGLQDRFNGRFIDALRIATRRDDHDWYQFSLADAQLSSISVVAMDRFELQTSLAVELFDERQNLIASAESEYGSARIPLFRDHTNNGVSDTYYVRISGDDAYSILVTKDTVFDVGSGDVLPVSSPELHATVEISGPVAQDSFSIPFPYPRDDIPVFEARGWVGYVDFGAIHLYQLHDTGWEFHQTIEMPDEWWGSVVMGDGLLLAKANGELRTDLFRLDQDMQWTSAGFAEHDNPFLGNMGVSESRFFAWVFNEQSFVTELKVFEQSEDSDQWLPTATIPFNGQNHTVFATNEYLLVGFDIYRQASDGSWQLTQSLDPNEAVLSRILSVQPDSIIAKTHRSTVQMYRFSTADQRWVPEPLADSVFADAYHVDGEYIFLRIDNQYWPLRNRNGDWYFDTTFTASDNNRISVNGVSEDFRNMNRIDSWQKAFLVNVADNGSIHVNAKMLDELSSANSEITLSVEDLSGQIVATAEIQPGASAVEFEARNLSAGQYKVFARRRTGYAVVEIAITTPPLPDSFLSPELVVPESGSVVGDVPQFITMHFPAAVNAASADLSRITINNQPVTAVELFQPNVLRVRYDFSSFEDGQTIVFEAQPGAFQSLLGVPNDRIVSSFQVDSRGPRILSVSVADGAVLPNGTHHIQLQFDESLDPDSVTPMAFRLQGIRNARSTISDVRYDDTSRTVTVTLADQPDDSYTLVVPTNNLSLTDLAGNRINESRQSPLGESFQVSFYVDCDGDQPRSMQRLLPLGSLVAAATGNAWIHSADDLDVFTVVPSGDRPGRMVLQSQHAAATVQFQGVDYVLSEGVPQVIELSDLPHRSLPLVISAAAATEVSWQFIENASVEIGDNQVALVASTVPHSNGRIFSALARTSPRFVANEEVYSRNRNSWMFRLDPLSLERVDVFRQDALNYLQAYNGQSFFELEGSVVRSYSVDPFLQTDKFRLDVAPTTIAADITNLYALDQDQGRSTIHVIDLATHDVIDRIDPPFAVVDIAVDSEILFLLTIDGVYRYSLTTGTHEQLFALPESRTPIEIALNHAYLYVRTQDARGLVVVDRYSRLDGSLVATDGFDLLLSASLKSMPDQDRFELPSFVDDSMTVVVGTTDGRKFAANVHVEDHSGQAIDVPVTTNLANNQFLVTLPASAEDRWLVVESALEYEYSVVAYADVAVDHSITGQENTADAAWDKPELAVVHHRPQAWVSNSFQVIEYDAATWQPVRAVVLPTTSRDSLATDGGRIYAIRDSIEVMAPASFSQLDSISRFGRNGIDITEGRIVNGLFAMDAYGDGQPSRYALNLNMEGVAIAPELGRIYFQHNRQIFGYQYPFSSDVPEPVSVFDLEFQTNVLDYSGGRLYVNDQSTMYALDPQTGNVTSAFDLGQNRIDGFVMVDQPIAPSGFVVSGTSMHFGSTVDVGEDLVLTVTSLNQAGTGSISVLVSAESGDRETIALQELADGVFRATITTTEVAGRQEDQNLSVTFGDVIRATYLEDTNNQPIEYHVQTRINHLAETTLPTRRFWLEQGQTVSIQIDRLDLRSDNSRPPLLAAVVADDNLLVRLQQLTDSTEQMVFTTNHAGYYSLHLQTRVNSAVEVMTHVVTVDPDVNQDGVINGLDVDRICTAVSSGSSQAQFDVNRDQRIDHSDVLALTNLLGVPIGDSNFDGQFNSQDLVAIFTAAEYEDAIIRNSTWSTGDWNCDGEFNSSDLVKAFQANTYSLAARIPERLTDVAMISAARHASKRIKSQLRASSNAVLLDASNPDRREP